MRRSLSVVALILLVAGLLTVGVSRPVRAGATQPPLRVLILGDSYSAGTGNDDYLGPPDCKRSPTSWGVLLSSQLSSSLSSRPVDITNRACNGGVTRDYFAPRPVGKPWTFMVPFPSRDLARKYADANCWRKNTDVSLTGFTGDQYWSAGEPKFALIGLVAAFWPQCNAFVLPQLYAVNATYDLVVMTVGGNDVGFGNIVQNCLLPVSSLTVGSCIETLQKADRSMQNLSTTLPAVVRDVNARLNPSSRSNPGQVLLMSYPSLIKNHDYAPSLSVSALGATVTVSVRVGAWLDKIATNGENIQRFAIGGISRFASPTCRRQVGVFADGTRSEFAGHELQAPVGLQAVPYSSYVNSDPWLWQVRVPLDESVHPKPIGHQHMANVAYRALQAAGLPGQCGYPLTGISPNDGGVSAGNSSCAALIDGTARCWGVNHFGVLGNGSWVGSPVPVVVSGLANVKQIATGYTHSCAVLTDGTARCWGSNGSGELGNGSTTDSSVPVVVSGLANVKQIAAGLSHSCAVLMDGTARCWGSNYYGELGDGSTAASSVPVAVVNG